MGQEEGFAGAAVFAVLQPRVLSQRGAFLRKYEARDSEAVHLWGLWCPGPFLQLSVSALSAEIPLLLRPVESSYISQTQIPDNRTENTGFNVCLLFFFFPPFRAGKGVFSAMKLGKARPTKDDHRKQGRCREGSVPRSCAAFPASPTPQESS